MQMKQIGAYLFLLTWAFRRPPGRDVVSLGLSVVCSVARVPSETENKLGSQSPCCLKQLENLTKDDIKNRERERETEINRKKKK